jgi:hypothetical protein
LLDLWIYARNALTGHAACRHGDLRLRSGLYTLLPVKQHSGWRASSHTRLSV